MCEMNVEVTAAVESLHAHTLAQSIFDTTVRAVVELVEGVAHAAVSTLTGDGDVVGRSASDLLVADPRSVADVVGPVTSFVLESRGGEVTSLAVYPSSRCELDDSDLSCVATLARQASLALAHARRHQNLLAALETRTTIGIALGILMERLRLDEDAAFAYLKRLSETRERKVRDVAADMVADHLTSLPPRP